MHPLNVDFCLIDEQAQPPAQAHQGDACFDLHAVASVDLWPGDTRTVPTGVRVHFRNACFGLVCSRSGLATRGIFVANAPGIIDNGYTGEIRVILTNQGHEKHSVEIGHRIAQLLILPLPSVSPQIVSRLEAREWSTDRGQKGFGSTGS